MRLLEMQPAERIYLELLTAAHAEEMFIVLNHPAIYTYISEQPPRSVAALAERYHRLEARCSPDGTQQWLNWAVRRLEDDRCIGYVQATVYTESTADLAFVFSPLFWGSGLAYEASDAAIALLFTQAGLTSIFATVDRQNVRSSALLLRLGFQKVPAGFYPHGAVENNDDVFRLERRSQRGQCI